MALVTLQTILQDAFPAYEQTHPLPPHVCRAARALMQCRTAALGGSDVHVMLAYRYLWYC